MTRTQAGSHRWVVMLIAGVLVSASCGDDASPALSAVPSSEGPHLAGAPLTAPASTSTATAGEGISAEDAAEAGVLTGPFDALITDVAAVGGSATATLRNVGEQPDRYELRVEGGNGVVDPAQVDLKAGDSVSVELTFAGNAAAATLIVISVGRGGEVARIPLG